MDHLPILARMVLALGIVMGLIFGSVWAFRKVAPLRLLAPKRPHLKLAVVGQVHLAPRRSVYALQTAGKTLLLGVTPAQVTLIGEVESPADLALAPEPQDNGSLKALPGASGGLDRGFRRELDDVWGGMDRTRSRLKGEDL
jgi:flagellar biogenesis protein FliO